MKFTVYQFDLNDKQYENPALRNLYLDCIMKPDENAVVKAKQYYTKVCEIDAENFNEVFEIGNIGPQEKIERIKPMRSVSVGDVILCNKTGVAVYVAPYSFEVVNFA